MHAAVESANVIEPNTVLMNDTLYTLCFIRHTKVGGWHGDVQKEMPIQGLKSEVRAEVHAQARTHHDYQGV